MLQKLSETPQHPQKIHGCVLVQIAPLDLDEDLNSHGLDERERDEDDRLDDSVQ